MKKDTKEVDTASTTDDDSFHGPFTMKLAERYFHGADHDVHVFEKVSRILESKGFTAENTL